MALDGLRGIAAVVVVLAHVLWAWPHHLAIPLLYSGYFAVDLFFILSGFVIARAYGHRLSSGPDVALYAKRRFFRIYPLYAAALAVLVGHELLKLVAVRYGMSVNVRPFEGWNSLPALVANVLFVQGWFPLVSPSWNMPAWSTSVEVAAYGMFAVLAWAGLTRDTRVLVLAALTGLTCMTVAAGSQGPFEVMGPVGVVRGFSGFSIGVLIERLSATARLPNRIAAIQWPAAIGLAAVGLLGGNLLVAGPLLAAALVASLHQDEGRLARRLSDPVAQHLARISYALYIVHYPLLVAVGGVLRREAIFGANLDPWVGDLAVVFSLVVLWVIAYLAYRLVEEPARQLGYAVSRTSGQLSSFAQSAKLR